MGIDFKFSNTIKGFMADDEAQRLYKTALEAASMGPCLEIGSYCGKSAYFIGTACREKNNILFSIDHHQGSEEQQPGQEYFDPDLYDPTFSRIDTFPLFRQTLEKANLLDTVVPLVTRSTVAGQAWATPLSLVFIDGGHTEEAAFTDYRTWTPHLMPGGFLLVHDIFMDPSKGGQAPRKVYESAQASGLFDTLEMTATLGVLKRRIGN